MRWMLLIVALAGCHAGPPAADGRSVSLAHRISSGYIGCPPEQIEISNAHMHGANGWSWRAECQGRVMYCGGTHCADAIDQSTSQN